MKQLVIILMMLVGFSTSTMAQSFEHVVKIGEDFASIAQKYGIPEQELMEANPKSKICYVGLKLIVPRSAVKEVEPQAAPKDEKADKKDKKDKKEKVEKQDKKEKAEKKEDKPKKSGKLQRTRTRKSKS